MIESDNTMTAEAKVWVGGFAQMMKPSLVSTFKDSSLHYIETGKWEETNTNNDWYFCY